MRTLRANGDAGEERRIIAKPGSSTEKNPHAPAAQVQKRSAIDERRTPFSR
jgi:hypothetical protein